jgi:YD repeat-containing protein
LAGYGYSYDAASRIASNDSLLDGLTEYGHDDPNQLIEADHASIADESYEYDESGNRIMSGYSTAGWPSLVAKLGLQEAFCGRLCFSQGVGLRRAKRGAFSVSHGQIVQTSESLCKSLQAMP